MGCLSGGIPACGQRLSRPTTSFCFGNSHRWHDLIIEHLGLSGGHVGGRRKSLGKTEAGTSEENGSLKQKA